MEIKLVQKMAWKFSKKYGVEYDDLFQEASLYYLEAMKTFDKEKGTVESSWAYTQMYYRLNNYCKKEKKYITIPENYPEQGHTPNWSFQEKVASMNKQAQTIVKYLFEAPEIFLNLNHFQIKDRIVDHFKAKGWSRKDIWAGFQSIRATIKG